MARHNRKVEPDKYSFSFRKIKCQHCGETFEDNRVRGRRPKYCSDACKQKAYRESKKQ